MEIYGRKIDEKIEQIAKEAEIECRDVFEKIEKNEEICTAKVLSAFIKNRISERHFTETRGYGYDDDGREALDRVFADIFAAEDALVRHNFVNGTHALSTALWGVLRPGDLMLSVTSAPYDTLEEVIGIRKGTGSGSLMEFGVQYKQIELLNDKIDLEKVKIEAKNAKVVYIQRSRGYSLRKAISIGEIKEAVDIVKKANGEAIVIVDNCYGEFTQPLEPTDVGADLIVGSLIKNPGGGIAATGGYIAGKKEYIDRAAQRLTVVGMGKEVGCNLGQIRPMLMGIFNAPSVTAAALKTAAFAAKVFEKLGYETYPGYDAERNDIIQAVKLGSADKIEAFCRGIQSASPIDSNVVPEAWDMPGYDSKVIMAAGTFTSGASIELSADAPMREPFAIYFQGALTYYSGKAGIIAAADEIYKFKN
ncbi:MAG: methionine gamma-lyase family protein [Oscillospiraceae bacterium]|nr:methionine gamma-lyase family protein [Oscillospiraceae bacterium]